jgi:hypothetical protein
VVDVVGHSLVFTPSPNFGGTDEVTIRAVDASGGTSSELTVEITVIPTVDAPFGQDATVTLVEDSEKDFAVTGFTVDNANLDYDIVSEPLHGTITFFDPGTGLARYRPNADFNGDDTMVFEPLLDGSVGTSATITFHVTPVNDAPIAANASVTTPEDTPISGRIDVVERDGDPVTASVVTAPRFGSLVLAGLDWRYTPNANFHGGDSFDVIVDDGALSDLASVAITVASVADRPTATDVAATIDEDTFAIITLAGATVDGDALTYLVTAAPSQGTLSQVNPATGTVVYTPQPNANGPDSFQYVVTSASGLVSDPATVTLDVRAVNDARPEAAGRSRTRSS